MEKDLAAKKALSILKGYFPAIDPEDLADVLDKCQGDLTWTVNLLLDSGYQCSGQVNEDETVEQVSKVEEFAEQEPPSESEEPPSREAADNETDLPNSVDMDTESLRRYVQDCRASQLHKSRQTQFESFQHLLPPEYQTVPDKQLALINSDLSEAIVATGSSAQDSMTDQDMKNNDPMISMTLDAAFAKQLINLFGDPYAGKCSRRSKATSKNTFDISWTLAEQIYLHWLSSLYGDGVGGAHVADATTDDFEFAVQLVQRGNDAERQQLRESLATKLSLQNLRESYPHIDPLALNALFQANNYNYANTITAVNVILGTKPRTDPSTRIIASAPARVAKDGKGDSAAAPSNKSVAPAKVGDADDQDARSEAFVYKRLQREYAAKALENHRRGMHAVSTYYATESRRYGDLYREANQAAAFQIIERKNVNCGEKTIDLHELRVIEALSCLESFIADNIKDGKRVIQIITGQGNHSVNGRPRIKPAVITFLKKKKYGFEELNPGMLRVYLRR